jgi:hypothetical protein
MSTPFFFGEFKFVFRIFLLIVSPFLFFFFEEWVLLCGLGWPGMHYVAPDWLQIHPPPHPQALAFQVLGLQVCTTISGFCSWFLVVFFFFFVALEFELKAYTLSHPTNPFL